MNALTLKSWLQRGELDRLEHVVLEGRGARLLGEYSPDLRTRVFLKGLPNYLVRYTLFIEFKNTLFIERIVCTAISFLYFSDENLSRARRGFAWFFDRNAEADIRGA